MAQQVFSLTNTGGYLLLETNSGTWADIRGAAVADAAGVGSYQTVSYRSGTNFGINRSAIGFNTSSLASLAKSIDSVTLNLTGSIIHDDTDSTSVHVVATDWSAISNIVTANYNDLSFTSLGSETLANIDASGAAISIATAQINTTGYTEFYLITSKDQANEAPSDGAYNDCSYSAITLTVNYTPLPKDDVCGYFNV